MCYSTIRNKTKIIIKKIKQFILLKQLKKQTEKDWLADSFCIFECFKKHSKMRKTSSTANRIREKCKEYLVSALIFILFLCQLLLFRCKSRGERIREHREKREAAKVMSEIQAIESDKHPVYTIQGKNKTLELPMEITDKGNLVSVIVNGNKTGFQLSDEDSEFTVSPQGALAWHETGVLTTEEIGGEETVWKLQENIENDSLTIRLLNVRIGNCVLPEVNAKIIRTQEFPYLMGTKAWNMLLSSLSSEQTK